MKVPTPKQRKSGSWYVQLRLNGKSIFVTAETKKECLRQAELIKAEYRSGKRIIEKQMDTVGDIIDRYIEKYEPVLSVSTIRGYESIRKNRFQSVMDIPVDAVKDWQKVINDELKEKSPHTVKNGWGAVSAALKDAGIAVPNVKLAPVPENELPFLQPQEIKPFIEAMRGDPAEVYALLELHSLRESEALAVVKNHSFDLKNETIIVNGAIVPNKEHKYVEKATNKTKKSTRTIPIMIPRLKELLKENDGQGFAEMTPLSILKHVHAACERAGVTDVTNHGLRRTFASLGYSLRVPMRVIIDMGGWSNPNTVHRVYIKLSARDKEQSVSDFASFYADDLSEDEKALSELLEVRERYKDKTSDILLPVFEAITTLETKMLLQNATRS